MRVMAIWCQSVYKACIHICAVGHLHDFVNQKQVQMILYNKNKEIHPTIQQTALD